MNHPHHHLPQYYPSNVSISRQPLHQQRVIAPIRSTSIPQFNLSQLPQIPVIIPPHNGIIPPHLAVNMNHNMIGNGPILSQSTTSNHYDMTQCIPSIPSLPSAIAQSLPNISYHEPRNRSQRIPPKPPSPTKSMISTATSATATSHKSRKRSISETKDESIASVTPNKSKRRKLSDDNNMENNKSSVRTATNRVWRQTRQNAKFRMAINVLDGFRSDHGGKLPSLRAIMKMLKVGFPKAHEILDEYARHIGCSKDKLVEDMTIRQEKKNKCDDDASRKKRMNRSIFEFPINVNGKLQEIILNLLHQKRVCNTVGCIEMYTKLEKSLIEFEGFYNKFGLNDKLRLAQSYFILSDRYFYDFCDYSQSYQFIEKALSTFRDCNCLSNHTDIKYNNNGQHHHSSDLNDNDIGPFWGQIFEVYMLCGHILLDNTQYYDAKRIYLCAYSLAQYMAHNECECIALESLSHVSKLELQTDQSIDYICSILKILSASQDVDSSMINTDSLAAESDIDNCTDILLINVRAYYSCILSLDCFENGVGFNMNKAMQMYASVTKECIDRFGESDETTFALYLYFALHFVNIEKFDLVFDHIEYVMKNSCAMRRLNEKECALFEQITNAFIRKLLSFANNDEIFNNAQLKSNCLKMFEYQLRIKSELKEYELNKKERLKKEMQMKKEEPIKKEEEESASDNMNMHMYIDDENDLILNQQCALLFYKFGDFDLVQNAIQNVQKNSEKLKPHQIEKLNQIKKEMSQKLMNNHNINNMHEMHCDFNVLPNFLSVTAPKSMS